MTTTLPTPSTLPVPAAPPSPWRRRLLIGGGAFAALLGVAAATGNLDVRAGVTRTASQGSVEAALRAEVETDLGARGLPVRITALTCATFADLSSGATLDAACTATIEGANRPFPLTVQGTLDGSRLDATFRSDANLLDASMLRRAADGLLAEANLRERVTDCTLTTPVHVIAAGDVFTCRTDEGTVELTATDGQTVRITDLR